MRAFCCAAYSCLLLLALATFSSATPTANLTLSTQNPSPLSKALNASMVRQQLYGTCRCMGRTFEQRFDAAFTVVKAQVIREQSSCKICRAWNDDSLKIHMYIIKIWYQSKGPKMTEYSTIQGFSYHNLCGRRLRLGQDYLLMLPDPGRTSPGSFWFKPKKWPQVSQCEVDYFPHLTDKQFHYILNKRWRWEYENRK